ncbi:spore coat protein CotJB [Alkaliphilus transvaalensis]|uniref:spore coat protein CotJB n=1 Tax=Alkaliphilus transvaalensis TaxID=114628 RepID=UPI00047C3AD5|nr:spore coat protein CotJB [Alkaliphilus transvaalensis]
MHDQRMALLRQIQEVEFAALELNLYLDTHMDDQRALMEYNQYAKQLAMLKHQYEMQYGPLFNFGFSPSQYPWRWLEGPWPWEQVY